MNALLRHLAIRFWLTALGGGALCLLLLPWWQQVFGLHWLPLPVIIIQCTGFGAAGWLMNRLGMAMAQRQVNEAAVWERAGMIAEAEVAFQSAAALFDSFWLSPLFRQNHTRRLSGALARFYFSRLGNTMYSRTMVANYLKDYPQDEALAENWIETLICREDCLVQEHEAVARVGETLSHHRTVQRLLMQYYLANGRTDFVALQTYRRVWKDQQPLETTLVHALERLLRSESILTPWAFQVYVKAYQTGQSKALEGIVAGLRQLPVNEENHRNLVHARNLVAGLDETQLSRMTAGFRSLESESLQIHHPVDRPQHQLSSRLVSFIALAVKTVSKVASGFGRLLEIIIRKALHRRPTITYRHMLYAMGVGTCCALAVLIVLFHQPSEPVEPQPSEEKVVVEPPVINDPFTIQVAAYLKSKDAQRFVDQLTENKLDAFWTKANSANRTWYQVKISHFPTREAAQKYGRDLKSKGLIDDFYVANYEPR